MAKSSKVPHYELKRVYNDGTESEPIIIPVTRSPLNISMNRRSILGTGLGTGLVLALILGKDSSKSLGNQKAIAQVVDNAGARAHGASISKIIVTPDNTTFISSSLDDTIKFWELSSGALFKTLRAEQNGVRALALSPDGNFLVSGGFNGEIKVWELQDGVLVQTWEARQDEILTLDINPDNITLASGGADGTIKLWNLKEGTLLQSFQASTKAISSIAISTNGHLLASGDDEGNINLWQFTAEALIDSYRSRVHFLRQSSVTAITISPNSQTLAAGDFGGGILLIDGLADVAQIRPLVASIKIEFKPLDTFSNKKIEALDIGPDDETLYSTDGNKINIWNFISNSLENTLELFDDLVTALSVSKDGQIIVAGTRSGVIKTWNKATQEIITPIDLVISLPGAEAITYELVNQAGQSITYTAPPSYILPSRTVCICHSVLVPVPVAPEQPEERPRRRPRRQPNSGSGRPGGCSCNPYCTCDLVYY